MPWLVPICAVGLMAIGLSGILRGDELASAGAYAPRQLVWMLLGVPAMFVAALFPYRQLKPWSYPFFAVCLVLLVAVYFFPARNYAHRWIPLGVADLQPSELAKLAYILTLSRYLIYRRNYRSLTGLIVPFGITAVPVVLILREPDLGTSLLFFPVLFAMLFAAGARFRHLASVALMGVLLLPALWTIMSAEQRSRITAVFTQVDGGPAPKGDGYHLHQSKQVLALGGVWGSELAGMPVGDELAYHLPASRTDFIFCLVGERWGLLGTTAVFVLYLTLFARGLFIAAATQEPFGRLLVVGILSLLATQLIINTGMTVGLMPITGLTLPLLSYGGSSLVTTCIALGLVMNVGLRPGQELLGEPFKFSAAQRPRIVFGN
jgi:cell division protein FtsW (lipid II flippase)